MKPEAFLTMSFEDALALAEDPGTPVLASQDGSSSLGRDVHVWVGWPDSEAEFLVRYDDDGARSIQLCGTSAVLHRERRRERCT